MKRVLSFLMIALVALALAQPAEAGKTKVEPMGAIDLTVATDAVTTYGRTIQALDYEYIAFSVFLDVTSGGGAGGGIITFEGRVDTIGTWETIPFITTSDSLDVISALAVSSTSDILLNGIISIVPINLEDFDEARSLLDADEEGHMMTLFYVGNIWPYEDIRMKVVDTDWNAAVKVDGFWILRPW